MRRHVSAVVLVLLLVMLASWVELSGPLLDRHAGYGEGPISAGW
jgi:hypothetical protein